MDFSFGKEHRLCGKKAVDRLFAEGRSFFVHPFRCVWLAAEPDPRRKTAPVQVLISVPKKNHKRAVVRNRLKRRIREAYRLNRHGFGLQPAESQCLMVGILYGSKEILDYQTIEDGLVRLFTELGRRLAAGADRPVRAAD